MPYYRLKHSFTAGELSPLMNERVDFERYRNGCKTLRNMVCLTQGPATRRPGFKFIADLNLLGFDVTSPVVRLIPFIFNEVQSYTMIFFNHTTGPMMVLGTTTEDGEDGLVFGSGGTCEYDFDVNADYTGAATYNFNFATNLTYVDATGYHVAADGTTTTALTEVGSSPGADEFEVTYTAGTGIAGIEVGAGSPATGGIVYFTLNFTEASVGTGAVVSLSLPNEWNIEDFDWAQSADEMYIAQSGLRPHIIKRYGHSCWSLVEVTFANEPSDWSVLNGWPERVTFHQQRVAFAANTLRRQTIWMSQAGDFNNFGIHSPLQDSDAITFTLDSGTQNRIQWIASGKSLHVGTMGNEWTITGNDQSALTPENILAQRQTNNGGETNKPLLVGLTTLFVERHGRTVNEFVYDYTYDSYKTSDMAILSPHLTEQYSIIDWTYQQTPDSIIWCVREDGTLLGITYQRQHKVVGWHRHDTQGEFLAVTCVPGNTREDDVWVIVKREINGVDRYFIEKMEDWFIGIESYEGRFLDSHVHTGTYNNRVVGGFSHLAGEEVDILADGAVHPPQTVSSSGEITLNGDYGELVVGLPYESEIEPNLVMSEITRDGADRGRAQRISEIHVDLYKSLGMWVGRVDQEDGDFEDEVPFRVPSDLMGRAVPLFTGWYTLSFPLGFDREAAYYIKQKQPFPLTVRGVTDVSEVFE